MRPGSGCWHSSKTVVMDCATGGDPAFQKPFVDVVVEQAEAAAQETALSGDADTWRHEVAARLERYRARRKPRAPRYPSLLLPFDAPDARTRSLAASETPAAPLTQTHASMALEIEETRSAPSSAAEHPPAIAESYNPADNLVEFPRSAAIPVFCAPELADPVLDRPRIVEAPEVLPPPPALGGILIEPATAAESDKKSSSEDRVAPATIPQRLAASAVDGLILGVALAGFAEIFIHLNPQLPPLGSLVGSFLGVAVLAWCTYEFLFIVYTGSTPGKRALKLRLVRFDGSPTPRKTRRWRVLASFLSAFSLGLGYLWGILDEDGLCWHDRITRTYFRGPSPVPEKAPASAAGASVGSTERTN